MRLIGILLITVAMAGCATRGSVKELTALNAAAEAAATVNESRDLEQDDAIEAATRTVKNAESNAAYAAQAAIAAQKAAEESAETAKRAFDRTVKK